MRKIISMNTASKSYYGNTVKVLKNTETRRYLQTHLQINNVKKCFLIHRLVAKAFIPNPENLPEVNHKDGNKSNNCVENLEWVTSKEISLHAHKIGLIKVKTDSKHHQSKLTADQVEFIRKNYKRRDPEFGGKTLAKKFNVSCSAISQIINFICYKE